MFKIPASIAQDLLLIQDLVGTPIATLQKKVEDEPKSTSSSPGKASLEKRVTDDNDSESDSEDEVEANLSVDHENDAIDSQNSLAAPESSDSESDDSSDSESDNEVSRKPKAQEDAELDADDDEEAGPATTSAAEVRTKNEVPDSSIVVPDITEVDPHEALEEVGEILSIVDGVVIVKGTRSRVVDVASERALDTGSLLVFDDRKVLGYVYETFGPTSQPLYQIKFSPSFPLNRESITVSRAVYHVPSRSKFVFASQLKAFRGSDASNWHDEEVGEDELEFSDDEAEAAFKRVRKHKRHESRERSVASSRFSTPVQGQIPYDQSPSLTEDGIFESAPFDVYGIYDMDTNQPGPSRPAPMPYDDPYQDSKESALSSTTSHEPMPNAFASSSHTDSSDKHRNRGSARGHGQRPMSGRGRGRGQSTHHRGRGRDRGRHDHKAPYTTRPLEGSNLASSSYDISTPRPLSPTSMVIAQATGQYASGVPYPPASHYPQQPAFTNQHSNWASPYYTGVQHQYPPPQINGGSFDQGAGYVQPHINPRFASLFGIGMNVMQGGILQQPYSPQSPYVNPSFGGYHVQGQIDSTTQWGSHSNSLNGSGPPGQEPVIKKENNT